MAVDYPKKQRYSMDDLLEIMAILRGGQGCPWDKEQTHQSIRKNLIEETYEVCEAIDLGDRELLKEELGDLTLQVVFHSQMAKEAGEFTFDDVCDGICKKLILRHPHIFAESQNVSSSQEVLDRWDQIKQKQKGQTTVTQTLKSVPAILPALMRSEKVQKRAAKCGFDYDSVDGAMGDLNSELEELKEAIREGDVSHVDEELGDLLFSVVNVARFVQVDPEKSLTDACEKFIQRFAQVEECAGERGKDLSSCSLDELNALWVEAKKRVLL